MIIDALFNPVGRVSVKGFWLLFVVPLFGFNILASILSALGFSLIGDSLAVLTFLFFLWPSMNIIIKRLHDLGRTGWLIVAYFFSLFGIFMLVGMQVVHPALLLIAGVLNLAWLVMMVFIAFVPGSKDANHHGASPRDAWRGMAS